MVGEPRQFKSWHLQVYIPVDAMIQFDLATQLMDGVYIPRPSTASRVWRCKRLLQQEAAMEIQRILSPRRFARQHPSSEYVHTNMKTYFRRLWTWITRRLTSKPQQLELNLWSRHKTR